MNRAHSLLIRIAKSFDFDAAHFLPMVPEGHKCRRMHGHTYRVEFMFDGIPNGDGMLVDYSEISAVWSTIYARIDHRVLNEIKGLENPTTEILAPWIGFEFMNAVKGNYLPHVVMRNSLSIVRVYESSTTWCEFYP